MSNKESSGFQPRRRVECVRGVDSGLADCRLAGIVRVSPALGVGRLSPVDSGKILDSVTIEVLEGEPCVHKVRVSAPAEFVASLVKEKLKLLRNASVPGFRPGKVPAKLLRKRHKSEIDNEVIQQLLGDTLPKVLAGMEGKPASMPRVAEGEATLTDGEAYECELHVDMAPTVELPGYEGITIQQMATDQTAELVEQQLLQLQQQYASYEAVERALAEGDLAKVSYAIVEAPETEHECQTLARMLRCDEQWMQVGGREPLPGLSEALIGAEPNQELSLDVAFPEDWEESVLAGNTFAYTVTLLEVNSVTLPEVTDEWAKETLGMDDAATLRERIEQHAKEDLERQNRDLAQAQIMTHLTKEADFDLPPSVLMQEEESVLRRLAQNKHLHSEEEMLEFVESSRNEVEETARYNVRSRYILQEIAEAEGIEANDDAVQHGVAQLRMQLLQQGRDEEEMDSKSMESTVRFNLVLDSTVNRILELAEITDFTAGEEGDADEDEAAVDEKAGATDDEESAE